MILLAALLWGCVKAIPPLDANELQARVEAARRVEIIGPVGWQGVGLCMWIPYGWAGTTGAAPQLLEVQHENSGATVRLQAWPWGTPLPREQQGYALIYRSETQYRTIPALTPSWAYTLSTTDGALTEGWVGKAAGRDVVVELVPPFGRATEGRMAFEKLMSTFRTCDEDLRSSKE